MSRAVVAIGRGVGYAGGAAIGALALRALAFMSSSAYVAFETVKKSCELGFERDEVERVAKTVAGAAESGATENEITALVIEAVSGDRNDDAKRIASAALSAARKTAWAPFVASIIGASIGVASVRKIFSRMDRQDDRISGLEQNLAILIEEIRQQRSIFHSGPVFASETDLVDFCTCPITLEIIDDPVYLPEDRTLVERSAFEMLFNSPSPKSPLGRISLGAFDSYTTPLHYVRTLDQVRRKRGLPPSLPTREAAQTTLTPVSTNP